MDIEDLFAKVTPEQSPMHSQLTVEDWFIAYEPKPTQPAKQPVYKRTSYRIGGYIAQLTPKQAQSMGTVGDWLCETMY